MTITTFRIKEKFWFWDADFWIQDESGKDVYKLSQRSWINNNLSLKDHNNNERVLVRKPMFVLNKDCYQICIPGQKSDSTKSNPTTTTTTTTSPESIEAPPAPTSTAASTATTTTNNNGRLVILAELKEKKVWFQSVHVVTMDKNVDYIVDASKWKSHSMLSIQHKGFTITHVYKKWMDLTRSSWVDINVDSDEDIRNDDDNPANQTSQRGLALLVACLLMIRILHQQDAKATVQERKEAIDRMPLQIITSSIKG